MQLKHIITGTVIAAALSLTSCGEQLADAVGNSLVEDKSEIVIDSDFKVTGETVDNSSIVSRSMTQMLGSLTAKGYGSFSSDFVTQFMPASRLSDKITRENIDSLKLLFFIPKTAIVGDTMAVMGLDVYRLTRQLPVPIFSSFNPEDYYDASAPLAKKIYACNAAAQSDSVQALSYRTVDVKTPIELAYELFDLYQTNPDAYSYPSTFAQYFPGVFVKNSFGSGCVAQISSTVMRLYYHTESVDSEGETTVKKYEGTYYAVSPEVVQNNNINFTLSQELKNDIANGESIIVAPVGKDVKITLPLKELLEYYRENAGSLAVVNTLTLTIPADTIKNNYGIEAPEKLLMILEGERDQFFLESKLPDNKHSFVTSYDSTNKRYRITVLRDYFVEMLAKSPESIEEKDYTFVLTPVNVESEETGSAYYGNQTTYIAAVNPYIGVPTMARLQPSEAKITLTFSKQTID